ncbi:hypothetical protein, partial [Staphylococcus aureus]
MHNLSEFPFTVKYIIILLVTAIIALILTPIMVVVSRKLVQLIIQTPVVLMSSQCHLLEVLLF